LEEAIETGKMVHKNLLDVTFSIEEIIAAGNRVIVRYVMRGTQVGELQAPLRLGKRLK
jgi:predicted ester cyclase